MKVCDGRGKLSQSTVGLRQPACSRAALGAACPCAGASRVALLCQGCASATGKTTPLSKVITTQNSSSSYPEHSISEPQAGKEVLLHFIQPFPILYLTVFLTGTLRVLLVEFERLRLLCLGLQQFHLN